MLNTEKKVSFLIAVALLFTACSGSKQDNSQSSQVSSKNEVAIIDSAQTETQLNEVLKKISDQSISAREAGKKVSEILGMNKSDDLSKFNYDKNIQVYSNFSQSLQKQFGSESDNALTFLAETLQINTLEGFETKTTTEKEQIILSRVGALREKSYLELEFFLASYFINNKIFESLKTISNDTADEDLTYCKGYLLKFVKDIYAKNSRYPDAFSKYVIWGQVLNECNLAPIYLPFIGGLKVSQPMIPAEQQILANVLKSEEAKKYSTFNVRFDEKVPLIINSLIAHTLYVARALGNSDQVVYDLDSINNALNFLDKTINANVSPDKLSQLNFADHLWFDLYLNLSEVLSTKSNLMSLYFNNSEKSKGINPLLKIIGIKVTQQIDNDELNKFLNSNLVTNKSPFLDKWELIKDSLRVQSYIAVLSKKEFSEETKKNLHLLKNRMDKNIQLASQMNPVEELDESQEFLYQSLGNQLQDSVYVGSGKNLDIDEFNFSAKVIIINPLGKMSGNRSKTELDLNNVRVGYFDFTPKSQNISLPAMVPFIYGTPKRRYEFSGKVSTGGHTEFECLHYDDHGGVDCGEHPNFCKSSPCISWAAHQYKVSTDLPSRPGQPTKVEKAMNGIKVSLLYEKGKNSLIVFANGENGFKGVKGTDSPFCMNNIYNVFTDYKNGYANATARSQENSAFFEASVGSSRADVEAGLSGEGGDGGQGGTILFRGNAKAISLIAIGGTGGDPGEAADCSSIADRSRPLVVGDPKIASLLGRKGQNGLDGKVSTVENSNEK